MSSTLKVDILQDSGGNNIIASDGSGNLTTQKINYPAFGARGTSDQAISSGTFTQLTFPTEEFDTDNAFASNTFTVPSGKAGKYFFSVQAEAKNTNNQFHLYWVKNGTRDAQHRIMNTGPISTADPGVCMTALFDLSDGDTVSVDGYRVVGGDLRYKWFQGFRIGD